MPWLPWQKKRNCPASLDLWMINLSNILKNWFWTLWNLKVELCDPNKNYLATLLGLGNAACLANHSFSLFLLAHSHIFFYLGPVFAPLVSSWSNRPNPPARQVTASPPDPWESMYNTREDLVDNVTSRTDIAKGRTDILTKGSCDTHHAIKAECNSTAVQSPIVVQNMSGCAGWSYQ